MVYKFKKLNYCVLGSTNPMCCNQITFSRSEVKIKSYFIQLTEQMKTHYRFTFYHTSKRLANTALEALRLCAT